MDWAPPRHPGLAGHRKPQMLPVYASTAPPYNGCVIVPVCKECTIPGKSFISTRYLPCLIRHGLQTQKCQEKNPENGQGEPTRSWRIELTTALHSHRAVASWPEFHLRRVPLAVTSGRPPSRLTL